MFRRRYLGAVMAAPAAPAPTTPAPAADPLTVSPGLMPAARLGSRYRMVQRLATIRDDYYVQNERAVRAFRVDGKALRSRRSLIFRDMRGNELCKIQERMLHAKDSMAIEGPRGERMALVNQALFTPLPERFSVKIAGGAFVDVRGNILDHEYTLEQDGRPIASVSKRWFRVRDSYGVEIEPGQNEALILAIATCFDQLAHAGPARR
jgi:uncharacterized protein YxjI